MPRLSRLLLFVFVLQLHAVAVQAALVLKTSTTSAFQQDEWSDGRVADVQTSKQERSSRIVHRRSSAGLEGNADVQRNHTRIVSLPSDFIAIDPSAGPCWRFAIENRPLPCRPCFSGLLKPS